MLGLCFIDNQNFTTFTDKIRKSQDFKWHQNLWEISETCNLALGVGSDDIMGFFASHYFRFLGAIYTSYRAEPSMVLPYKSFLWIMVQSFW